MGPRVREDDDERGYNYNKRKTAGVFTAGGSYSKTQRFTSDI
jgi:hypothetical protein